VVNLRKIGPREEWTVDFFVDDKETPPMRNDAEGIVGMDVGWRLFDDGSLRVACWYGEDGEKGEYRLSKELIGAIRKADELRSVRDMNFNEALSKLVQGLKRTGVPEWMCKFIGKKDDKTPTAAQACSYLAQWKSAARLATFTRKWCSSDEGVSDNHRTIYEELEKWRYHDFHLWEWETSQRIKADRRRKNEYRNLAASLAKRYKILVLENFDLRKVIKRKGVEEESDNQTARSNRKIAAISELRDVLKNAFEKCGEVRFIEAKNTTKICAECGAMNEFDQAANLEHTCTGCGTLWDQDENASRVIYSRGTHERSEDKKNLVSARMKKNGKKLVGKKTK
jgi:transcription initiation factor IIE alpha subunit